MNDDITRHRLERMLELLEDLHNRGALSTKTYCDCIEEVVAWSHKPRKKAQGAS